MLELHRTFDWVFVLQYLVFWMKVLAIDNIWMLQKMDGARSSCLIFVAFWGLSVDNKSLEIKDGSNGRWKVIGNWFAHSLSVTWFCLWVDVRKMMMLTDVFQFIDYHLKDCIWCIDCRWDRVDATNWPHCFELSTTLVSSNGNGWYWFWQTFQNVDERDIFHRDLTDIEQVHTGEIRNVWGPGLAALRWYMMVKSSLSCYPPWN